jgi:flavin reductase (DIM6/NTAB) family NADH-FMN oxidoreductase RutF
MMTELDPTELRNALGQFATGVTVVTIAGPQGFTANSFASVSLDPPLVLWSPARASARFPAFSNARHFAIHVLAEDQFGLSRHFVRGGQGFEGVEHEVSAEGVPLLAGTLARFECVQEATHDGGDHLIVIGRVLRFAVGQGKPLVFAQGGYGAVRGLG